MPFGAHETMEVHEILNEKINMLNHFSLYAQQAHDPMLKDLLYRHMQAGAHHYDQLVGYTHDYSAAQRGPIHQAFGPMQQVQPEQIVYGLDNPARVAPLMMGGGMNDSQILWAVLSCHKNSAKNHMAASLEASDPNVRRMLLDGAAACNNFAYETFLLMNRMGLYQVPTMHDHTAKTYLHTYQPMQPQMQNTMQ